MANYRIAQDAKADLRRIYRTGFDRWGEAAADKYYASLFERFEQLARKVNIGHPLFVCQE